MSLETKVQVDFASQLSALDELIEAMKSHGVTLVVEREPDGSVGFLASAVVFRTCAMLLRGELPGRQVVSK